MSVTPNCFKASMLARKLMFEGLIKCPFPCRGKKKTSRLLNFVFNILSDGLPHGVSICNNSLSLNSSTSYKPLPPMIANLLLEIYKRYFI